MTNHLLTEFLKKLRSSHKLSIQRLAEERGMSRSTIYKAESNSLVEWPTIERAYCPLCPSAKERNLLLALWALAHVSWEITPDQMSSVIGGIREEEKSFVAKHPDMTPSILETLQHLSPPDRDLFTGFARSFGSTPATRSLAQAWLTAMGEIKREKVRYKK